MLTYAQLETDAIRECEHRLTRRIRAKDRGRLKCAHAHVLQSIWRHGAGNSLFLKQEAYRSVLASLGIWELLAPIVVPFLKQAIGVLVEYLMQFIDGLVPSDPQASRQAFRMGTLTTLATEAHARWPQRGEA